MDGSPKVEKKIDKKHETARVDSEIDLNCKSCGKVFSRQAVLRVHLSSCKKKKLSSNEKLCDPLLTENGIRTSFPLSNDPGSQQLPKKSGILVRKDYNKKLNCNSKNFSSTAKNSVEENSSCKRHSVKRIDKWRTVLQRLQSKRNLDSGNEAKSNCF